MAAQPGAARSRGATGWAIAGLGFLGYYAASFLDFIGLQWVGAGVGRLILYLFPTLVLLLSFLFLQKAAGAARDRRAGGELRRHRARGVEPDRPARAGCSRSARLLVFASALCYAVYLVAGSQMVKRVGSMRFTAYSTVVATVPAVIQFLVLESTAGARSCPPRCGATPSCSRP